MTGFFPPEEGFCVNERGNITEPCDYICGETVYTVKCYSKPMYFLCGPTKYAFIIFILFFGGIPFIIACLSGLFGPLKVTFYMEILNIIGGTCCGCFIASLICINHVAASTDLLIATCSYFLLALFVALFRDFDCSKKGDPIKSDLEDYTKGHGIGDAIKATQTIASARSFYPEVIFEGKSSACDCCKSHSRYKCPSRYLDYNSWDDLTYFEVPKKRGIYMIEMCPRMVYQGALKERFEERKKNFHQIAISYLGEHATYKIYERPHNFYPWIHFSIDSRFNDFFWSKKRKILEYVLCVFGWFTVVRNIWNLSCKYLRLDLIKVLSLEDDLPNKFQRDRYYTGPLEEPVPLNLVVPESRMKIQTELIPPQEP